MEKKKPVLWRSNLGSMMRLHKNWEKFGDGFDPTSKHGSIGENDWFSERIFLPVQVCYFVFINFFI